MHIYIENCTVERINTLCMIQPLGGIIYCILFKICFVVQVSCLYLSTICLDVFESVYMQFKAQAPTQLALSLCLWALGPCLQMGVCPAAARAYRGPYKHMHTLHSKFPQ